MIQIGHPHASAEDIERRLALRMKRQKVLLQPGAPSLWAVVDEAALWRLDGRSVMQEQMQHLIDMAELPNITLQVMPIYSGAHAAVGGPFTMLRFAEPDLPDLVYLEQLTSALYLDKSEDVRALPGGDGPVMCSSQISHRDSQVLDQYSQRGLRRGVGQGFRATPQYWVTSAGFRLRLGQGATANTKPPPEAVAPARRRSG